MAMACSLSCLVSRLSVVAGGGSTSPSTSNAIRSCSSLAGTRLRVRPILLSGLESVEKRSLVVYANAAESGSSADSVLQPSSGTGDAPVEGPVNPIAALQLQSDLLKKKAKRLIKRRKRLLMKRHLRKKGRWPPSKMWKNKNV